MIVIAGPNGSGKTTVTSKILKHEWLEDSVYINPDQVAQDMFGDWIRAKLCVKPLYIVPTGGNVAFRRRKA